MKTIIFDLDDTLYNNKNLRETREKTLLNFLGQKKEKYIELRKSHGTLESLKRLDIGKDWFFRLIDKIPVTVEKDQRLADFLKKLRKRYKLIVLSNTSAFCVEETLKKLGILELIDEYYSGEDFDSPKPAKECFFMVKEKDICIGDNFKNDLEVPKQKGAITVFIGEGEHNADFKINSIYELDKILE